MSMFYGSFSPSTATMTYTGLDKEYECSIDPILLQELATCGTRHDGTCVHCGEIPSKTTSCRTCQYNLLPVTPPRGMQSSVITIDEVTQPKVGTTSAITGFGYSVGCNSYSSSGFTMTPVSTSFTVTCGPSETRVGHPNYYDTVPSGALNCLTPFGEMPSFEVHGTDGYIYKYRGTASGIWLIESFGPR